LEAHQEEVDSIKHDCERKLATLKLETNPNPNPNPNWRKLATLKLETESELKSYQGKTDELEALRKQYHMSHEETLRVHAAEVQGMTFLS